MIHASPVLRRHDLRRNALSRVFCGAALLIASLGGARAEEPHGCEGFKWPIQREAALLNAPDKAVLASGAAAKVGAAVTLKLVDLDAAALPKPPERTPKVKPSKAGFLRLDAPPTAGSYQVTISQGAWVDVIQDDHYIKPSRFSGAQDCPGVRKSLRVMLSASPVTVQVSGTQAESIDIAVLPSAP